MRSSTDSYYLSMWATMDVLPGWHGSVCRAVGRVRRNADLYENLPAPWQLVGVIHWMECGCDRDRQIFNGERWDQKTVLYPPNHGPWISWREAAREALAKHNLYSLPDVEAWNGWGYAKRGVNSPYLWSGSNHGIGVGKFVERGGKSVYDPSLHSKQVGAALVLRALGWKP